MRRAIKWFTAQAFPDLTMAPFGDMGGRVSLAFYSLTAEIGYRYLGTDEAGSYRALREGNRGMVGFVYGVDTIKEKPVPYRSAYLSSGYVALKREANGNRLYAGLNAVQPGEGHQHGDRLNLLAYSRDRMLTGEKPTRYEDEAQRTYSGASYAHNTVTVDETSQIHGYLLKGERVPHIESFVDLPAAQVAEAHGDRIYEQTRIYRRLLCQFDEYLLDIFLVEGGKTHDWLFHGVGERPEISIPMELKTSFEPALYVMRGKSEYSSGAADRTFSATWRRPADPQSEFAGRGRDVFSRVTVAGIPGQTAYLLSTYPDPGEHSLMVRHAGILGPFVAVHEASFGTPVLAGMHLTLQPPHLGARSLLGEGASGSGAAVEIVHTDGGRRLAVYEGSTGPDGLACHGRFCALTLDPKGRVKSLILVRGTEVSYRGFHFRADREISLSATFDARGAHLVSSPSIGYETLEGMSVYNVGQTCDISIAISESASPSGQAIRERMIRLPGQTPHGPAPIEVRW
jgi:hypothetical protein